MPDDIDFAEKLLRGEMAAVESYERALDDLEGEPHRRRPGPGRRSLGAYTKAVEKVSAWIGDTELLEAMKQGEIHGLSEYRTALASKDLPAELETVIREELLPRQKEHVAILDRLIPGVSE